MERREESNEIRTLLLTLVQKELKLPSAPAYPIYHTLLHKKSYLEHTRVCSHPLSTPALRGVKREKELMSTEELPGGRCYAHPSADNDHSDTVIFAHRLVTWPRVIHFESFEVGGWYYPHLTGEEREAWGAQVCPESGVLTSLAGFPVALSPCKVKGDRCECRWGNVSCSFLCPGNAPCDLEKACCYYPVMTHLLSPFSHVALGIFWSYNIHLFVEELF